MMLLIFIAMLTRAAGAKIQGEKMFLRHNAHGAAAKAIRKAAGLATTGTQMADITMREGLGENTPQHGCGYLGTGYNIVKGNPAGDRSSMLDPGYRRPVVRLTWSQQSKFNSRDLQKLQPKEGWGIPIDSCQRASSVTTMKTMSDYTTSLEANAQASIAGSAEGGLWGFEVKASASFSQSLGVKDFRNNVLNRDSEQFEMNSYCKEYKMGLNMPAHNLTITDYFADQVSHLPVLEIAYTGECAKYRCTDMFVNAANKYMVVDSAGKVSLSKVATGKWYFKGKKKSHSSGVLMWVTKQNGKWKQPTVSKGKVLTRVDAGVVMQTLKTVTSTGTKKKKKTDKKQLWEYILEDRALVQTNNKKRTNVTRADLGIDKNTPSSAAIIVRTQLDQEWAKFFSTFGTHFLSEIELGGRMKTIVTMTSASSKSIQKTGISTAYALKLSLEAKSSVSGNSASVDAASSGDNAQEKEAMAALDKSQTDMKTFVLGGEPPEELRGEGGFSDWAATVDDAPMPVVYQLVSIALTWPFQCDLHDIFEYKDGATVKTKKVISAAQKQRCKELRLAFSLMFAKLQDNALVEVKLAAQAAFLEKKRLMKGKKDKELNLNPPPPPIPDTWEQGTHNPGAHIQSKNGDYNVYMQHDGNLVLYNKMGDPLWASDSSGCSETTYMAIQQDSNVVVYCGGDDEWDSDTDDCGVQSNHATKLVIQDDGDLVLLKEDGGTKKYLWHTATAGNNNGDEDGEEMKDCD